MNTITKQLIEKEFVWDYGSRRLRVCHGEEVSQQGAGMGAGTGGWHLIAKPQAQGRESKLKYYDIFNLKT